MSNSNPRTSAPRAEPTPSPGRWSARPSVSVSYLNPFNPIDGRNLLVRRGAGDGHGRRQPSGYGGVLPVGGICDGSAPGGPARTGSHLPSRPERDAAFRPKTDKS